MSTTYNRVHYGRDRMRPCIYGPAGVYHGFGAIPQKRVGQSRGKAVTGQCI